MPSIETQPDLFSPLFRWAHRQGENFVTDAFVFLVQELLRREQLAACSFLDWLCYGSETSCGFTHRTPSISTQLRTKDGTPDICIQTPQVFVLVEVKKGSDLHEGQLGQYRTLLDRQTAREKRLVLLTAFDATFGDHEKPDRWVRWSDVQLWFEQHSLSDSVSIWLVSQFLNFLRRQVMAIEKVEWQYIEGTKGLYNLTTMLGKALENAGIPLYRGSAAWDSRGHYTKDKQFWTGIYMGQPEILRFQFDTAKPDIDKLKENGWEYLHNAYATSLDLSAESVHFFARSKDSQLEMLTDFVRHAFDTATKCVVQGVENTSAIQESKV